MKTTDNILKFAESLDYKNLRNISKFEEDNIILKSGKKIHCDCGTFFPLNQKSLEGLDEIFK